MRNRLFAFAALGLAATACSACTDRPTADPNQPAVVLGPPVVLPSDTAKPDTAMAHNDRLAQLTRELAAEYSVLGTATTIGDRRMIASIYAPDAVLKIADTTITSQVSIAFALADLGKRTSMKDMARFSRVVHTLDSVVVDSGSYVIRGQRAGSNQAVQRGTYAAVWRRVTTGPTRWMLLRDELIPAAGSKAR